MLSLSGLLQRAAQIGGAHKVVNDAYFSLSWRDIEHRAAKSAGILEALSIAPGDRVAVLMQNSVRLLELVFAIERAGGVYVPVNFRFAEPEIMACLADCDARFFIVEPIYREMLGSLGETQIEAVIICDHKGDDGAVGEGDLSYAELYAAANPIESRNRSGDDVAAIFYTSGTTGQAKGVILTQAGIVTNELQWVAALGLNQTDRIMIVAPMFHAAGALNAIGAAALGAGVYFVDSFEIGSMLSAIETHRVTKIGLIVVMLDMISRFPGLGTYDLTSVRKVSYGGSPITDSALANAREAFSNAEFYQVYGQTEGGPTVSVLGPEHHIPGTKRIRSAGFPVIGAQVVILGDDGGVCPMGQTGEICVAGPGVSPGYWNMPEETARSRHGHYLKTGDAGYVDDDGFLFICDRVKDMIISGGENVYSSEVENALMKYDGMEECAVIGIPSKKWGEQVHAIVRLRKGDAADEQAVIDHCRKWLAGYKTPRSVEFRIEPLPVSSSVKILKTKLREPYWKNKGRSI